MGFIPRVLLALTSLVVGLVHAEEGFKPNGTLGLTQTFYGNSGGYETAIARPTLSWNYNFAQKWNLLVKWDRTWGLYDYTGQTNQQYGYYSQPAATLSYNHGHLDDSKVKWSSSVMAENQTNMRGMSTNYIYAQTAFDFAEYLPRSEAIQATQFAIAPQFVYGWRSQGSPGHVSTAGLALLSKWQLPANFSFTFNAYAFTDWYDGSFKINGPGGSYSNATYFVALAWLQYQNTLHQFDDRTSLDFNFIGGLDPYIRSNRDASWNPFLSSNSIYEWLTPTVQQGNLQNSYVLFALPQLVLSHQVSKKLSVNLFFRLKYSNQVWGQTQGAWSFQPQGGFGMTYSF